MCVCVCVYIYIYIYINVHIGVTPPEVLFHSLICLVNTLVVSFSQVQLLGHVGLISLSVCEEAILVHTACLVHRRSY